MTSASEYSNNGSSTSTSSHQYDDVLESLHEIDNRSLGYAAGSSHTIPHYNRRPGLTEQKTGFLDLAREQSYNWTNFGGHNSVQELGRNLNVPSLRYATVVAIYTVWRQTKKTIRRSNNKLRGFLSLITRACWLMIKVSVLTRLTGSGTRVNNLVVSGLCDCV